LKAFGHTLLPIQGYSLPSITFELYNLRQNLDIEEVTIDPSANWVPVEKRKDTTKDDEGI
jgi:hypothetical protein